MKHFILTSFILLWAVSMFADNFTNKFETQKVNINKDIDSTIVIDLNIPSKITSLSISGICKLSDYHRSLFRAVLVDKNGYEYLVAEYIGYLEPKKNINFKNQCIETILLDKLHADKLKIVLSQARVHINSIEYSVDENQTSKKQAKLAKKMQNKDLANRYNDHNKEQQMIWLADTLSNSAHLSYMEKKKMYGNNNDYFMTDGIEYYSGGFFVVHDSDNPLANTVPIRPLTGYISNFSWANKHGRNWNSPVKSQVKPANESGNGGCWAFATVAVAESYINLYYNQKIDLDLSEQQIISCSNGGTNQSGGHANLAANYIIREGLISETCFPFSNTDEACDNQCVNPEQIFVPKKFSNAIPIIEDSIKRNLIHNGPLLASINNNFYHHAMSLVGYGMITENTKLEYLYDGQASVQMTIPANSPLIGRTYWIFKNSYGTTPSSDGYMYVIFDKLSMLSNVYGYFSGIHSLNGYDDTDVKCEDLDGDGYYNWGIGTKPSHCPNCPNERDADDFNPYVGGMNEYGFGKDLSSPIIGFTKLIGPDTITCDGTYLIFGLRGYQSITWRIENNFEHTVFLGNKLVHTTTQNCPMATFVQGKSLSDNQPYTGYATIKVEILKSGTSEVATVLEKQVYVAGSNTPYVNTNFYVPRKNETRIFTALNCDQTISYNILWSIRTPSQKIQIFRGKSISYKFTESGTYDFEVKNLASCDADNVFRFSTYVMDEEIIIQHNNPAKNTLSVSIQDNDRQTNDVYTIELWHDQIGMMNSKTSNLDHLDIKTEKLGIGYYTILLYKNGIFAGSSRVLIN